MLFDVKGIVWTLVALVVVAAFCALDLKCAKGRDSAQRGSLDVVKGEIAAGVDELATQRADAIRVQIRDLRIRVRKLLKAGDNAEARRLMGEIQKLERRLPDR